MHGINVNLSRMVPAVYAAAHGLLIIIDCIKKDP